MIKKQVDFQYDKFFIGTGDKAISKEQVREEIKAMMKNGWEVFSTSTPGYDSQFGDVIYVITLVKYEYVEE